MTFHEKSRGIALVANLAVWGWYFVIVARAVAAGYPDEPYPMWLMVPVIGALTIIHVVAHIVVAVMNPSEANEGLDERGRAIGYRASAWGYDILCVGVFAVIVASFFWWNSFMIVNSLMFAFILAETVRYAIEIRAYRRGLA
ncbi:MAG: hypothetical protein QOD42_1409 [Sphingomonadales bacterium]|jgi:hypothetical protein|nr:hypothetical protein [Sphingomonadales bacterium]